MICPLCGSDQLTVTNSRSTKGDTQIWRRRNCLKCGFVFTTHEMIDLSHLIVIKRSGRKVKFSRAKLYSGIYHAVVGAKKIDRGDAGELAEKIMGEIEKIIIKLKKKKIGTKEIKKIVLDYLKNRYRGHYLRYLAYFGN